MLTPVRATILGLSLAVCFAAYAGTDAAVPAPPAPPRPAAAWTEVLNRYLAANHEIQTRLHDTSMEVDIDGRLPRLKKEGSVHIIRQIGRLGQIMNDAVRTMGDKMVNKDLIARYLNAEAEASRGIKDTQGKVQSIAISPDNYRFKLKAVLTTEGNQVYVFQLTPKKNRLGLFKGEVWVDADTGMPVRESGRFVKSPSKFLRRLDFVREYQIHDGLALPTKIESRFETFLWGKAELDIRFSNYSLAQTAQLRISPLGW